MKKICYVLLMVIVFSIFAGCGSTTSQYERDYNSSTNSDIQRGYHNGKKIEDMTPEEARKAKKEIEEQIKDIMVEEHPEIWNEDGTGKKIK